MLVELGEVENGAQEGGSKEEGYGHGATEGTIAEESQGDDGRVGLFFGPNKAKGAKGSNGEEGAANQVETKTLIDKAGKDLVGIVDGQDEGG